MKLLVAVDFSEASEVVIDAAAEVARYTGGHVYLIHVVPDNPDFVGYEPGPETVRHQIAVEVVAEHRQLQAHAQALRDRGLQATALLLQGYPAQVVLREASRLEAGLIVIGSHGHGAVYDLLIGSVSEQLIRTSSLPLLMVPIRAARARRAPGKPLTG